MFTAFEMATIESLIEAGKALDISHDKLHSKAFFIDNNKNRIITNYTSLLDKYSDHIAKFIVTVELTDLEFEKYRFQPKLLCYDYYGTTELWSHILRINNLTSVTQFTKQKIKMFTEDIFDIINEIFILEEDTITKNRLEAYGK